MTCLMVLLAAVVAAAEPAGWVRSAEGIVMPAHRSDDWQAGWIWQGSPVGTRYFRKFFVCADPKTLRLAAAQWAGDDGAEFFVNGNSLGKCTSWAVPTVNDRVLPLLHAGTNEIRVCAWNVASSSAFMGELDLVAASGDVTKIGSGTDWEGAQAPEGPWQPVREFMRVPQPPYGDTPYVDYTGRRAAQVSQRAAPKWTGPAAPALRAAVRQVDGAMHYFENGVEKPFISYRTPSTGVWRDGPFAFMSSFDAAGVGLAEISLPLTTRMWREDGSLDAAALEEALLAALAAAPHMNLICCFNTDAPAWYVARHKDDRVVFDDGSVLDRISYASEEYAKDVAAFLGRTVAWLKTRPYYGRVAGFGLDGGFDGQFMQWTDHGYKRMGDYSAPMRRRFGRDLPFADRRRGTATNLFLDVAADADVIAYNRLFGSVPAEFLRTCARAVKAASDYEKIVCAYYGKFYSIAGYLECGEFAIGEILRAPEVDCLIAVEYKQRAAGMPHSLSAPTESYAQHNKLFIDEADIRTFLDGQKNWGYAGDEKGTESMIRKMFALTFTRGHGLHWYDLFGGWFAHPAIEKMITDVQKIAVRHCALGTVPAEIAVICDEESFLKARSAIKKETARALLHQQNGVLGRIGAPYDLYFAEDLAAAPKYKMYIFLHCFAPSALAAQALAAVKASGAAYVTVGPGDRVPTPGEYRARAKAAGVHIISEADDVMVYAGRGLLAVHAGSAGRKTLKWSTAATFNDAITGELIATGATTFELEMAKGETRILEVAP